MHSRGTSLFYGRAQEFHAWIQFRNAEFQAWLELEHVYFTYGSRRNPCHGWLRPRMVLIDKQNDCFQRNVSGKGGAHLAVAARQALFNGEAV